MHSTFSGTLELVLNNTHRTSSSRYRVICCPFSLGANLSISLSLYPWHLVLGHWAQHVQSTSLLFGVDYLNYVKTIVAVGQG